MSLVFSRPISLPTFKGTMLSMPIYGDMKDVKFQNYPFYPVVESPGVVFIVQKEDSSNAAQAVMDAVFQGWPVLLLTLIMAALSGIVVWALVSKDLIILGFLWYSRVILFCCGSTHFVVRAHLK